MSRLLALPILALPLALGGCPAFDAAVAKVDPLLNAACNDAVYIASLAMFVPGVSGIAPYITAACTTAEGLLKIAQEPSSTQWLGQMIGEIKALAATARVDMKF